MGMINEHLELQKRLMDAVGASCDGDNLEKLKSLLVVTTIALIDEGLEVSSFVKDSTKPWKDSTFNVLHIKEEAIDVWHFLLQLFVLLGMDENEIDAIYRQKNSRNYERIKEKMNAISN